MDERSHADLDKVLLGDVAWVRDREEVVSGRDSGCNGHDAVFLFDMLLALRGGVCESLVEDKGTGVNGGPTELHDGVEK